MKVFPGESAGILSQLSPGLRIRQQRFQLIGKFHGVAGLEGATGRPVGDETRDAPDSGGDDGRGTGHRFADDHWRIVMPGRVNEDGRASERVIDLSRLEETGELDI